jgi:hypothetical protein
VIWLQTRGGTHKVTATLQNALHLSQQGLRVPNVFENLFGIDQIERVGIERNIHSVKRTELRVVSPSAPHLRGLFNIKASPSNRRIHGAKVINTAASSATEVDDPLELLLFAD